MENYLNDLPLRLAMYEVENGTRLVPNSLLETSKFFGCINQHFSQLRIGNNLNDILPFLHHHVIQLATADEGAAHIGVFIHDLLSKYRAEEAELGTVLQIVHQVLQSLKEQGITELQEFGNVSAAFMELVIVRHSRELVAKLLSCLQLYSQAFNVPAIIDELWAIVVDGAHEPTDLRNRSQILVHFMDEFALHIKDFHFSDKLVLIIQSLLLSSEREERMSACFLLRKLMLFVIRRVTPWDIYSSDGLRSCWTVYAAIVESIDANESHLLTPSLKILRSAEERRAVPESWTSFMEILHIQILANKNTSVLRRAIECFLEIYTCTELSRKVQVQFLEALNNENLYNNFSLPKENIQKFFHNQPSEFFELFSNIRWKPTPLHFWLSKFSLCGQLFDTVSRESLLRIADQVGASENDEIRRETIDHFEVLCSGTIGQMDLNDYIALIEKLYVVGDPFPSQNLEIFTHKLEQSTTFNVSRRFYEIISFNLDIGLEEVKQMFVVVLKVLAEKPAADHAWLRFLIVFDSENSMDICRFCESKYGIRWENFGRSTLEEVQIELHNKLVRCRCAEEEEEFVRLKAVDFFFVHVEQNTSKVSNNQVLDFLRSVPKRKLLLFLKKLQEPLIFYCTYSIDLLQQLLFMDHDCLWWRILVEILESSKQITGIINCTSNYEKLLYDHEYSEDMKQIFGDAKNSQTVHPENQILQLVFNLIKVVSAVETPRKMRSWERKYCNMCIINTTAQILNTGKFPNYLNRVRENAFEDGQEVITHISLANFAAVVIPDFGVVVSILEQALARECTKWRIVAIFLSYSYVQMNRKDKEASNVGSIINALLPLAMMSHQETRISAQVVISFLLDICTEQHIESGNSLALKTAMAVALDETVTKFGNGRQQALESIWRAIRYLSWDDLISLFADSPSEVRSVDLEVHEFRRNLNPAYNRLVQDDFKTHPRDDQTEIYVVACLINSLEKLAVIADSCKAFGLKNLVVDSGLCTQSGAFRDFSNAAENPINIIFVESTTIADFLMEKQCEGFEIVAMDHSTCCKSFVDFQYPQKSVLLLGHPREGIPPVLFGFLDHVVAVPQFGRIPSLDVDVAGVLFMWEYSKQYVSAHLPCIELQ